MTSSIWNCFQLLQKEINFGFPLHLQWDTHVNLNTFKPNPLLKRASSERMRRPLRRSRRLAHKNGEVDEEEEDDDEA